MSRMPRLLRSAFAVGLALTTILVAGCGVLSEAPQRQLYRVVPSFAFPAAMPHVPAQLLVATPTAPAGIDRRRIALTRSPVSLDYFADAEWSDRVPFLVRDALVQGFEKSGAFTAVGSASLGLDGDLVLNSEVRDFQAVYDSPDRPPRVTVGLNVKLVRMPERRIIAEASLGSSAPAAANTVPDIVRAFNRALAGAVEKTVLWTVDNAGLPDRSGSVKSRTRFVHPDGRPRR